MNSYDREDCGDGWRLARGLRKRLRVCWTSRNPRSGQAMTEYLITAGILLAGVVILAVFLYTFKEHGGRALDLAASEYP